MRRLLPAVVLALVAACTTETDVPAAPSPAPPPPGSPTTGTTPAPTQSVPPTSAPPSAPSTPTAPSTPSRPTSPAQPPGLKFDSWVVGAKVLPRRPDGFGVIRPTPPQLRERLLPTPDLLPPPTDGRFHASSAPVTRRLVRRTDLAWSPACPVGLDDLRYLRMSFWGFDRKAHTGEMVVNRSVADDVVSVFRKLFAARFPLEEMRLVTQAALDAPPTGDGNGTAAYACRPSTGGTSWSAHAYGLAVDINPFNNPYVKGDVVLPELASSYLDREWRRPGMIYRDGLVYDAFEAVGWTWGGDWQSLKDLHHFSANGR